MAKFDFDESGFDDFLNDLSNIEIDCPECDHPFEFSLDDIGSTVKCPHCGVEIAIESED